MECRNQPRLLSTLACAARCFALQVGKRNGEAHAELLELC